MTETAEDTRVDYAAALAETNAYLARRDAPATARDLCAILADWVADGEALLYPMPALAPARPRPRPKPPERKPKRPDEPTRRETLQRRTDDACRSIRRDPAHRRRGDPEISDVGRLRSLDLATASKMNTFFC